MVTRTKEEGRKTIGLNASGFGKADKQNSRLCRVKEGRWWWWRWWGEGKMSQSKEINTHTHTRARNDCVENETQTMLITICPFCPVVELKIVVFFCSVSLVSLTDRSVLKFAHCFSRRKFVKWICLFSCYCCVYAYKCSVSCCFFFRWLCILWCFVLVWYIHGWGLLFLFCSFLSHQAVIDSLLLV